MPPFIGLSRVAPFAPRLAHSRFNPRGWPVNSRGTSHPTPVRRKHRAPNVCDWLDASDRRPALVYLAEGSGSPALRPKTIASHSRSLLQVLGCTRIKKSSADAWISSMKLVRCISRGQSCCLFLVRWHPRGARAANSLGRRLTAWRHHPRPSPLARQLRTSTWRTQLLVPSL